MRVLALTKYCSLGASSRVRTLQYLPLLRSLGWEVNVSPFLCDQYIARMYSRRSVWRFVFAAYWRRLRILLSVSDYDIVWIEKEALPWVMASVERFLLRSARNLVVDYDDAMFHRYDQHSNVAVRSVLGSKIDTVMAAAEVVIVGNKYLEERARLAGAKRVELVPTVIDVERYAVKADAHRSEVPVIGWIGSPETVRLIQPMFQVFNEVAASRNVRFLAVGARREQLEGSPFEAIAWSEAAEVSLLYTFDIGIMPLQDTPWQRGKCGYKLIQYMACSLPVVASPVGVNKEIVRDGENGFLPDNPGDWTKALVALVDNESLRRRMGRQGRRMVVETYTLQHQGPRLAAILSSVVSAKTSR